MKRLVVLVALALTGGVAASAPSECLAGRCSAIKPLCLYPDKPVCICQGMSLRCYWVCGH